MKINVKNTVKNIGKLSLALFMLASVNASAQDDDDEDDAPAKTTTTNGDEYLVTTKNDTVRGTIIDRDKKTNLRPEDYKVRVQVSPTEKKSFSPAKVKFYYKDDVKYAGVEAKEGDFAIMEVVEEGPLTLYRLDLERVKKGDVEVYETQWYVVREEKGSKPVRIKENFFRKDMPILVADNDDLVVAINDKDYVYEDLEKVVKEYNAWANDPAQGGKKKKKR